MAQQTRSITSGPRRSELARREGRWDPFALLDELEQQMARFWIQPFGTWPMPRFFQRMPMTTRWMPHMGVYEKGNHSLSKLSSPSSGRRDVQVELEGGDLVIRGESRQQREVRDEDYYRTERSSGSFYRLDLSGIQIESQRQSARPA